jgi:rare lipoprotein A (peptidoglycan hydrolase)
MQKHILVGACGLMAVLAVAAGVAQARTQHPVAQAPAPASARGASNDQVGVATWYGEDFDGRITASGERFDMYGLTAAHPELPFNSVVEVTDLQNGRSVDVRITDRPEPGKSGLIVVSKAAAANLGFTHEGSAPVRLRLISYERQAALR